MRSTTDSLSFLALILCLFYHCTNTTENSRFINLLDFFGFTIVIFVLLVLKMINKNYDDDEILDLSDLSLEEIAKIRKEYSNQ